MIFERDPLDAAVLRHLYDVLPYRDRDLIPLIIEDFLRLGRPRGRDPDRSLIAPASGRQAAHHDDFLDAEHLRELERLFRDVHFLFIGERISRAVKRTQLEALRAHRVIPFFPRGPVAHEQVEVAVRRARPVARADLDRGYLLRYAEIKHLLIRHIQCAGLNGQFHFEFPSLVLCSLDLQMEMRVFRRTSFTKNADFPLFHQGNFTIL